MRYISHGRIMHPRSRQTLDTLQHFLATPLANCLNSAHKGEAGRRILALFRDAADTVPAYRAFLHAHGVDAAAVCDVDAYRALPLMTKQNYMLAYPLAERCRYGALHACDMLAMSSGSTGIPTVWPRTVAHELGPQYEQIVLLGDPPFVKDVIDSGGTQHIDWPRYKPKLVFAGEVFSEEWRTLVCERIGADDPRYATASRYGTADGGVLGNETPLSIELRRYFAARPALAREVFGESRLPPLVQYAPRSRYIEVRDDDTLVVSGDSGVPLMRYHIADKGGIITFEEMRALAQAAGCTAFDTLHGCDAPPLPFVYLFGRADFTVSYFGANNYPENISVGLEQPEVRDWVSGKFVLQVIETTDRNQTLAVTVELLPGVEGDAAKRARIAETVLAQLTRLNSEFANYVPVEQQVPSITL